MDQRLRELSEAARSGDAASLDALVARLREAGDPALLAELARSPASSTIAAPLSRRPRGAPPEKEAET